ncbi:DUF4173 domain-containing protein [Armatimonas sp.]|uniref:DUF4153 domain-containing protein n=1 Tax=Armatimonas sp. TaxID=1872638 RepID=UPI00286A4C1E|nr:DUF4173 domain-containing protein [Armatimonas sp.]
MKNESRLPRAGSLLVAALGVGALADGLLYGQEIGLGTTLFLFLLPVALWVLLRHNGIRTAWQSLGPLLAVFAFFAVMLTLRASEFVTGLNLLACVFLLALLARFAVPGQLAELRLGELLGAPFVLLGASLKRGAPAVSEVLMALKSTEKRQSIGPLFRGVLLSVPVLLVLVPLLASADAVFSRYVTELGKLFLPERWQEQALRLGLVLLTSWLVAGGLALALTAQRVLVAEKAPEELPLGFVEAMTVLSSVATVFGIFLWIQLAYLFGGATRVLTVPSLTYADYARRGFAELVTVAALTLALILSLKATTKRTGKQPTHFAALSSLIVAETLVLLLSAWRRMATYEAAYGATQTRLHVDVFIVWLGLTLLWLVVTLWSRPWSSRFAIGGLACALGFAASLNILNPDALVAHQNIQRWEKTGKLDSRTLYYLSDDARSEITALIKRLPAGEQRQYLEERLERGSSKPKTWQSWHAAAHWK